MRRILHYIIPMWEHIPAYVLLSDACTICIHVCKVSKFAVLWNCKSFNIQYSYYWVENSFCETQCCKCECDYETIKHFFRLWNYTIFLPKTFHVYSIWVWLLFDTFHFISNCCLAHYETNVQGYQAHRLNFIKIFLSCHLETAIYTYTYSRVM